MTEITNVLTDSQKQLICQRNREAEKLRRLGGLDHHVHANDERCNHYNVTRAVCKPERPSPLDDSPFLRTHEGLLRERSSPLVHAMHVIDPDLPADPRDAVDYWIELTERSQSLALLINLAMIAFADNEQARNRLTNCPVHGFSKKLS